MIKRPHIDSSIYKWLTLKTTSGVEVTADKGVIKEGTPSTAVTLSCSVTGLETAGATISWWDGGTDALDSGITGEYSARKFQG